MQTCDKCKHSYSTRTCPRCNVNEEQKIASADVGFVDIASMIAESLVENAGDLVTAIVDAFDGIDGDW